MDNYAKTSQPRYPNTLKPYKPRYYDALKPTNLARVDNNPFLAYTCHMDFERYVIVYPDNVIVCRICRRSFNILPDKFLQDGFEDIHKIVCTIGY